jgi:pimeloyl-ACP methyl ester carboxylesterase
MPYLADSNRIFYDFYARQAGAERPAVLLLHGLGATGDDWPLQVPALATHYRVLTVDLPGHGRSRPPRGRWTIDVIAGDVIDLLDHLGEPPLHVVGLSLGGCVAQRLALKRPQLVRSLILVNTFARLRPAGLRGALRFGRRLWLLAVAPMPVNAAYIAEGLFPRPDQRELYEAAASRLAANPKSAYWNVVRALAMFNTTPVLGQIACPTLVVAGDRDRTIPLAAKQRLAQGIPGARLVVVADSGHATPYDQAEEFNRLVLEFLSTQT